jgi:hypothetical protein
VIDKGSNVNYSTIKASGLNNSKLVLRGMIQYCEINGREIQDSFDCTIADCTRVKYAAPFAVNMSGYEDAIIDKNNYDKNSGNFTMFGATYGTDGTPTPITLPSGYAT